MFRTVPQKDRTERQEGARRDALWRTLAKVEADADRVRGETEEPGGVWRSLGLLKLPINCKKTPTSRLLEFWDTVARLVAVSVRDPGC